MEKARAERCAGLELDSDTQRNAAHPFYMREGMRLASYHFTIPIAGEERTSL